MQDDTVNVRYMVDDVQESIDFYTKHLGFELLTSAPPRVRGCEAREPPAAPRRTEELGRTAHARR